jgi:hypothetical protein
VTDLSSSSDEEDLIAATSRNFEFWRLAATMTTVMTQTSLRLPHQEGAEAGVL